MNLIEKIKDHRLKKKKEKYTHELHRCYELYVKLDDDNRMDINNYIKYILTNNFEEKEQEELFTYWRRLKSGDID